MDTTKTNLLFLFNLVLFVDYSFSQLCFDSSCGVGEPTIRFPFQLQNLQPKSCGYPGFNLSCKASQQTVIGLPNSGQFTVQGIDYQMQHIWLNDPDSCLPRRLLTLNLSGSPFSGYFYQSFAFFNCTFDYTKYKLNPIGCLSGQNYTVFASSSERAVSFLASRCSLISSVDVPVQWTFPEPVATSDLSEDILLSWAAPLCGRCETRGGRCGLKSNSSTDTECTHTSRRGLPRGARYAIIAGAGVPALLFLVGLVCCLCGKVKRLACRRRLRSVDSASSAAVAPQSLVTTDGLDSSTIESYPKTILGESRRLPKPDDSICSICLSEYKPKETLRSIPECQHCFHADCVDQWLKLKASCPVCRNSPKRMSIDILVS
ncbi:RING/U-box superfamily protein [Dorcoceras hygrometricum]|uniref:RING-type E3 ubiquitin transferase n=1 Tax=Dorcoceras hygrometricum TaxID=472368 RepID=A0A2Z7C3D1_9LAMI|nr:RING/U-box superfamily protein [Dorcoceras hygrometricum]